MRGQEPLRIAGDCGVIGIRLLLLQNLLGLRDALLDRRVLTSFQIREFLSCGRGGFGFRNPRWSNNSLRHSLFALCLPEFPLRVIGKGLGGTLPIQAEDNGRDAVEHVTIVGHQH